MYIYIYVYAKPVVKDISWIFTIYQLVKDWTGFSSVKNQLSGLTTRIIHHPKSMKLTTLDFLTISDLTQQPIKTLTTTPWWFYIFDSRTNQLATSGGRKPWSNLKPTYQPMSHAWIYMVYLPENGRNSSPEQGFPGFKPRKHLPIPSFFWGEVITLPETDSSVSHLKMDGCLEY